MRAAQSSSLARALPRTHYLRENRSSGRRVGVRGAGFFGACFSAGVAVTAAGALVTGAALTGSVGPGAVLVTTVVAVSATCGTAGGCVALALGAAIGVLLSPFVFALKRALARRQL